MAPEPDRYPLAPKGEITAVYDALRPFARVKAVRSKEARTTQRLSETALADRIESIARAYMQALFRWGDLDRETLKKTHKRATLKMTREALHNVRRSALAFANAVSALDDHPSALGGLVGKAALIALSERARGFQDPFSGETTDPPPFNVDDDLSMKAFAPEISAGDLWSSPANLHWRLLQPTITRTRAIAELAARALSAHDRSSPANRQILGLFGGATPKEDLVCECAHLVVECFGEEAVSKITTTPHRPGASVEQRPPFEALVAEMHKYATGSDEPENFEKALDAGIAFFAAQRSAPKNEALDAACKWIAEAMMAAATRQAVEFIEKQTSTRGAPDADREKRANATRKPRTGPKP